eukprot:Tamp_25081.p1 GENE.Tamp_25081~~Tamp_25081.p1  ORF type:complete len:105 (+),score=7.83 Tamp_25081:496-810(+)
MLAQLEVGFQGLSEKYTSNVTLMRPSSIRVEAEDSGVFEVLRSSWTFKPGPSPGSSWVEFQIEFAFRNPLYHHMAAGFKEEVAKTMVGAFERRCHQLYAPKPTT